MTTAEICTVFGPVAMWATQTDHQRHADCRPGTSLRLPQSALIPFEDASRLTSRNLNRLPSEPRNWDYHLFQSLAFLFFLFPEK